MNWRKFYSSIDNLIQPSAVGLRLAMMNKLCIFSDAAAKSAAIRRQLGGIFDLTFRDIDNIHATESQPRVLFDIDLRDGPHDAPPTDHLENSIKESPGVRAGLDALHSIFSTAGGGIP